MEGLAGWWLGCLPCLRSLLTSNFEMSASGETFASLVDMVRGLLKIRGVYRSCCKALTLPQIFVLAAES